MDHDFRRKNPYFLKNQPVNPEIKNTSFMHAQYRLSDQNLGMRKWAKNNLNFKFLLNFHEMTF